MPHVNLKPLARKRIYVQTLFSHSTLNKSEAISCSKTARFLLHFLFRRDQNHNSNLTSKIMKMWTDLKKA